MSKLYGYNGNVISLDVLTNFVDITGFGAKGDGTTDDASAIQSALDSVQTGGIIYFPEGIYKLMSAVLFYSNQKLIFAPGATLLLGSYSSSSPNIMRNYNTSDITGYNGTHDVIIDGATFDGNNITGNSPTLLGFSHSSNIKIINCHFKRARGSWHDLEINSSKNVKVIGCTFDGSLKTANNGENIQIDKAGSSSAYPWACNYDGTVCEDVEIAECTFFNNELSPAIGNHTSASHIYCRIHDNMFDTLTSDRGAINFSGGMSQLDIYNNTFKGCTIGIGTSGATYYIYNNRFVDATTAISGSSSVAHGNMINGTYTA